MGNPGWRATFFPTPPTADFPLIFQPRLQVLKLIRHKSTLKKKKKRSKKMGKSLQVYFFFKRQQLHLLIGFIHETPLAAFSWPLATFRLFWKLPADQVE